MPPTAARKACLKGKTEQWTNKKFASGSCLFTSQRHCLICLTWVGNSPAAISMSAEALEMKVQSWQRLESGRYLAGGFNLASGSRGVSITNQN